MKEINLESKICYKIHLECDKNRNLDDRFGIL